MIRTTLIALLFSALVSGCATAKTAASKAPGTASVAAETKRKENPPVKVGSDIIVNQPVAAIWPLLAKVEDWGSWMPKITKVEPGAGLSTGAIIQWQWDEKAIESTVESVKDNEELSYHGSWATKKSLVKWTLKSLDAKRTLISLRTEVPYGTASEVMDRISSETGEWIKSINAAVLAMKPVKAAKKK